MIPSDVASSLRLIIPDQQQLVQRQTQAVTSTRQIADVLSNLVPGQRIMAEIQALMPNGNYRAVVGQRDITLSLPFSAKAGDTLELEVTESDGKLTLAFVANRSSGSSASTPLESVSTSLSTAGKVIGNLLTPLEGEGKQAAPAALNRNQPLVQSMPNTAADLAPVLKQALAQSGMFYEAHQARWASGQLPTAALLQQPQGKLSPAPLNAPEFINRAANFAAESPGQTAQALAPDALLRPPLSETPASPASAPALPGSDDLTQAPRQTTEKSPAADINATLTPRLTERSTDGVQDRSTAPLPTSSHTAAATRPLSAPNENPVPHELVPLVQQQLNGLATQSFVWQGQVWPGQPMWWEISGDPESQPARDSEPASQWQTRLKLDLPALGGIEVSLRLGPDGALAISVNAEKPASEAKLLESTQSLREQLAAAGLTLTQLRVDHGQTGE